MVVLAYSMTSFMRNSAARKISSDRSITRAFLQPWEPTFRPTTNKRPWKREALTKSGLTDGSSSATAFDLLAGARYWHQDATVSAEFNSSVTASGPLGQIGITQSGSRAIAASGSVDWVDPFVGGRLRYKPSAGQEVVVRGDIGGFARQAAILVAGDRNL